MLVTVIGRGHSGTRSISQTLAQSGFYMGAENNVSGDLVPPEKMYDACRVFAKYVDYKGGMEWDFSRVNAMQPDPEFVRLIEEYLASVLASDAPNKGWKIPETTLVYPWILKMFPDARYINWVRDPRDCILGYHLTDDLRSFGVDYDKTDDVRRNRAISWYYQRQIVKLTPPPAHSILVRFEDMVSSQTATLKRLEEFLGVHLVSIPMRHDSVGRYLSDGENHCFDFFGEAMQQYGYEPENR